MNNYSQIAQNKLTALKQSGQYRNFITLNRINGEYPKANIIDITNTMSAVVWCSNDYLGMSQHPLVTEAMHIAINKFGAGSGGSRNIGGTHDYYNLLETSLALWHQKESALVFPTGYIANDATLQCLPQIFDNCVFFSDAKNHASIITGIRSSKAEYKIFKHNDIEDLEKLLHSYPLDRLKIIVFESVYSMDGDIAPINEIAILAKKYNALTFLDEVHAIGMYGDQGAGMSAKLNISDKVDIIQGTMAKAIGVIGGYIAGDNSIVDAVRSFASGFIFTTSLPPAVVAACYASLEYLKQSSTERDQLQQKTIELKNELSSVGINIMPSSQTHILPVLIGDADKCKLSAKILLEKYHIYLQPINFPTVPIGTERFRINVTPNHTSDQIKHLAQSLSIVFKQLSINQ